MDRACNKLEFTLSIGIYGANFGSCILAPRSSKFNRNNELAYPNVCKVEPPPETIPIQLTFPLNAESTRNNR